MKPGRKLFRIFGIDIKIHISWWFIFILLAWSLSSTFFPSAVPEQTTQTYWIMGIVASLLLFLSVLLHELSHSLVAKIRNIKVESITLFFFGGVAGITDEDMKPSSEFLMAIAGPLFSLALAGVFYLISLQIINPLVTAITSYLATINFILALFNLVPGFPLDGGRAFRAILHGYFKDLRKATKIAVIGGRIFAGYMIFEGILNLFGTVILFPGGLWFILLGVFLYFIAGASYEQVIIKQTLEKIPVKELKKKKLPVVSPKISFSAFVKKHINKSEDFFLVQGEGYAGLLDIQQITRIHPQQQKKLKIKQVAVPFQEGRSVTNKDSAYIALRRMGQEEIIPVMERSKILGFLTRNTIMHRLLWELKFGEEAHPPTIKRLQRKT